jgi:hypothetical protein
MKKLVALLPLLLLGACADPAYSPGAWANYDGTYDWGFSGYDRPYNPGAYAAPQAYYPQTYYPQAYSYSYGPAYSYGSSYSYGPPCNCGGGYAPDYNNTYYEGPGYGPY